MAYERKNIQLSILHDELKSKLAAVQATKENQNLYLQQTLHDQNEAVKYKAQQCFHQLNSNTENLTKLYKGSSANKKDGNVSFFYQQPIEDFFTEEESFTAALTEYTRKQFFEGIADLAGARDKSRYDLLDVTKPESLLIKGETEEIKQRDREELQRLQSQYAESEEKRIYAELSSTGLKKAIETAEKQLQLVNADNLDLTAYQMEKEIGRLSEDVKQNKKMLSQLYESELIPLLNELQQLHSTKVLKGNYNLKIARQDYFLSKQNEVINQLLLQCSRNYFLSMLYEIELKEHRSTYHLIASSRTLLGKEIENMQKRIAMLSDPLLYSTSKNKETISSRDTFMNSLHDSIVPSSSEKEELYKTYDSMVNEAHALANRQKAVKDKYKEVMEEKSKQFDQLESTLTEIQTVLNARKLECNEELSSMISSLEEDLSIAELQVNDIIKYIVSKRKVLSTDSLTVMERTIFTNFFNDPSRLKRILTELQTRVNACISSY